MTKEQAIAKLISVAEKEIGYHEGSNNQNKYAEDSRLIQAIGWNADNQPWCVIFVVWCFIEAFGLSAACKMLRSSVGSVSAAVQGLASNFQSAGATTSIPTAGCPVCYSGMGHIGICAQTSPLTCVDGNYSDSVKYHWNPASDAVLYLIPDWSVVADTDSESSPEEEDTPEEESTTETFTAGDIVSLKAGATYYQGGKIPGVYFLKKWIVLQVNGDRAVLNASTDGSITGWMSPVNTCNLTKVSSGVTTATTTATQTSSFGLGQAIAEKIQNNATTEPVVLNPSSKSFTFGGKRKNVED